jgi:hypothetical protein
MAGWADALSAMAGGGDGDPTMGSTTGAGGDMSAEMAPPAEPAVDVMKELETYDVNDLVKFLMDKKILPDDFVMPDTLADAGAAPDANAMATGGFGDIGMSDMAAQMPA